MPVFPSDRSAVIARLRAAGCVFAEDEADLLIDAASGHSALEAMLAQRVAGFPLEHIVGWAEFCGLRIAVSEGVFVPRRRTEFLVEQAALLAAPGAVVLDLCCGSGALGAALAARVDGIELYASDLEPAAVRCAQRNLDGIGTVFGGDLYAPLPGGLRGRVDVLLANVPYVPAGAIATMPPEARDHEPRTALDGGADGLEVFRRVSAEASRWLAAGGSVLSETSEDQAAVAEQILRGDELTGRTERSRDVGATVVVGTKAPSS